MTIRLMGTGAADGIPALFGDDRVSRHAREHGGREVRSRSGAVIDGILKIDLPPDTWSQCAAQGVSPCDWSALVFTHGDDDHLALAELQYALYPFTEADHAHFAIYGPAPVIGAIRTRFPDWPIETHETTAFTTCEIHGYRVTPVLARHGEAEAHNLIVDHAGRTLLYATDTGAYGEETLAFLAGRSLDLLVIECTDAQNPSGYAGHHDLVSLEATLARMRREGALSPDARVVTTHHAARGDATHGELIELLAPLGAEPGYDGLSVTI